MASTRANSFALSAATAAEGRSGIGAPGWEGPDADAIARERAANVVRRPPPAGYLIPALAHALL
jgi:hypothetical protein